MTRLFKELRRLFCAHKWEYDSTGSLRTCRKCGKREASFCFDEYIPFGFYVQRLRVCVWR